jgi:hypothetical protein
MEALCSICRNKFNKILNAQRYCSTECVKKNKYNRSQLRKESQKEYYQKPEVKERRREYYKKARIEKREIYQSYQKKHMDKRRDDPAYQIKKKEHMKDWREKPEVIKKIKEYSKLYYSNPEVKKTRKEYMKSWRQKPETIKLEKNYSKIYQQIPEVKKRKLELKKTPEYKNKFNQNRSKRRKEDSGYKAISNLRSGLNKLFRRKPSMKKNLNTLKLIGCSREELKLHLEKQFKSGMNWENYNYNGWHIDHIIPLSTAKTFEEIVEKKLMHYTNLQPLWRLDNQKKGGVKN